MSLINDALKKAQRQRTGDSPTSSPPIPGGAPLRPARSTGGGLSPQLFLVGAGALLGLIIAGGAVFFLRSSGKPDSAQPAATAPAGSVETVATAKPAEPIPTSAAATPAADAKLPEPTLVVKTEPAPAVTTPIAAPAAPAETAAANPPPAEAPVPSLKMIDAIEALRVAGIRVGSGNDSKVLMNDRVYRLGDTVDYALSIKLTGVTANSLTFRDASGATYTRNF